MENVNKIVRKSCAALKKSQRRFEDIYNIIFSRDCVMAETSNGEEIGYYTYADARNDIEKVSKAIALETNANNAFIGIYADNCIEWIVLFWAILKSGNKPYLVNLRQPREFAKGILNTLDVEYVLCVDKESNLGKKDLMYADLIKSGEECDMSIDNVFANEIAISTSGTTLKEKICIYSGEEISAQVLNAKQAISWNSEIKLTYKKEIKHLMVLPLYHIFGLEAVYLWFIFFGVTFVFPKSMAPEVMLETVRKHKITHIFGVPLLWNTIEKNINKQLQELDEATINKFNKGVKLSLKIQNINHRLGLCFAKYAFKQVREKLFGDSIRFCISGGSYIKESTLELLNAIGYPLYNGYGMTEIGIAAVDFEKKPKHRLNPAIGKPFSSIEFKTDEEGKLYAKGISVCKKIIINGEILDNNEWFDTGDIVKVDDKGKYRIVGRASDIVINADGENLNPDLAEQYFELSDATCFSVLGDKDNENLILIVQVSQDIDFDSKENLLAEIENTLKKLPIAYRIKKVYYTYDALMGDLDIKVSRAKIKNDLKSGRINLMEELITREEIQEEESELKKKLRTIFASVLDIPESQVTNYGHFMNDLGGTSLDYYALVSEVSEEFGIYMEYGQQDFSYSLNDFERVVKELIK